jgi:hypothetical protein
MAGTVWKTSIVLAGADAGQSPAGGRPQHTIAQPVVFLSALQPCYSGLVIRFRQLSRSSISPCEQVGEHHGGAGGCLASDDSGGIRAGATDGGGELGGVVLQPLASSIGASSASVSHLVLFVCMGSRLLLRLGASLFFLAGIALAQGLGPPVAAVALRRCGQVMPAPAARLHRSLPPSTDCRRSHER